MREPCMCGDPYCPSCGAAMGNIKCPHCGKWSADGGCDDPEACRVKDNAMVELQYRDYLIDKLFEQEMKLQHVRYAGDLKLPADWFDAKHAMTTEELRALVNE